MAALMMLKEGGVSDTDGPSTVHEVSCGPIRGSGYLFSDLRGRALSAVSHVDA